MSDWDSAKNWYNDCVGEKGHYYHQAVVLPNALNLLNLHAKNSLLDLGCGQGVLARHLIKDVDYVGVDLSSKLIAEAKKTTKRASTAFISADASKPLPIEKTDFDAACFLLCLQNMEHPEGAIANASKHLKETGKLVIVLNHPCFRTPRQSSWGVDEQAKLQYQLLTAYLSPMKIPLQIHPGKGDQGGMTISYHYPISQYIAWLAQHGFVVDQLQEWCSDKTSEGGKARMENRARKEIPLFLAISALLYTKK